MIGLGDFVVMADTGEEISAAGLEPERAVCAIAAQKAKNVSLFFDKDDIIVAADTLVYLDGEPMGKPDDEDDAARMLRRQSGRRHTVYTGIAIMRGATLVTGAEATEVFFRELSDGEIAAYIKTGEPMDKAGAYGAQGRGALLIERIEGDFFNVMGLPLCRLTMMLRSFGVFLG